jgi:hypothetical protein
MLVSAVRSSLSFVTINAQPSPRTHDHRPDESAFDVTHNVKQPMIAALSVIYA